MKRKVKCTDPALCHLPRFVHIGWSINKEADVWKQLRGGFWRDVWFSLVQQHILPYVVVSGLAFSVGVTQESLGIFYRLL